MAFKGRVLKYVYRKEGTPLAGIPVSDGMNVTYTDENGYYELPGWERAKVINVGVLTKDHFDWFINIDGHEGDFDFEIDPANVDDEDFSFLHISDTEIQGAQFLGFLPFLRDTVKQHKPAFFMHTGDICIYDGLRRHHMMMNKETIGCPVRYVIGNHDFAGPDYGEKTYEKYYGPSWYSFDCGNIHFVALSIGYGDNMSGYERKDEWLWLENDLKGVDPNKRVIIFNHDNHPVFENDMKMITTITIDGVTTDLKAKNVMAWFCGHSHYNWMHNYDGFFYACSARPDDAGTNGTPASIRKVSLHGHTITSEIIYNMPLVWENDAFDWKTKFDGYVEYSSPVQTEDGDIFVCTNTDGYPKNCGIYRVNGVTGEIKFMFKGDNGFKEDGAYENGFFYAQDTNGKVYCIDAENGSLIWKKECEVKCGHTTTGVIIARDYLIAGDQQNVVALNKTTGEFVWSTKFTDSAKSNARYVYDEYRNQIICSLNWNSRAALDLESGKINWQVKRHYTYTTPLVTEECIYNFGYDMIEILDPVTGETIRDNKVSFRMDSYAQPVLDGDTLYLATSMAGVIAVDRNTLEVKRFYSCGSAVLNTAAYLRGEWQTVEATPIIDGGRLIFAANDGYIWFYNKDNGRFLKKISIGAPSLTTPIKKGKYIYSADVSGRLIKFFD